MTNFIYDFRTETGITIQTDTYCHYFDCARAAADAAYALLQGESTKHWDNNQPENRITDCWHGDQNDLIEIIKDWNNCKDDTDVLFASVFFEEVMLLFLVNGQL